MSESHFLGFYKDKTSFCQQCFYATYLEKYIIYLLCSMPLVLVYNEQYFFLHSYSFCAYDKVCNKNLKIVLLELGGGECNSTVFSLKSI
jgi:hypothetical protein